jgi:hypothetical protein
MTDLAIIYNSSVVMSSTSNPDIVHITGIYELTGGTDLNLAAIVDVPFDAASYSALSGFIDKVSATQFDIDKAGVYRIDFFCSCDDTLSKVRINIIKNNGVDVVLASSELTKNCSISVIASFAINDYILLRSNRLSGVTALNVTAGFSKLIITKLG